MRRNLAPETRSLIDSLHKRVSFWQSSKIHTLAILSLISQTRDPAAIPDIVALLLDSNRDVAQAAANAVSALTEVLNPVDLPYLDELMRERSSYRWSYPPGWEEMKPDRVGRLHLFGESSVPALGMASFHFSGYVRAEALRILGGIADGTELPFLLLRLNDWVKPVREMAYRLVRERLRAEYVPFFVVNILLVKRLDMVRRGDQQDVVSAIERLLMSPDGRAAFTAGLESPDSQVKRACYGVALRNVGVVEHSLIERALLDKDPFVRLQGTKRLSFIEDQGVVEKLLVGAMQDRFAPVRRKSLEVFSTKFPDQARPCFERALMDSHPSVRGYAQFHLAKASAFDLREFYRGALRQPDLSAQYAAIFGLGETGTTTDAGLIVPYATHEAPRIRKAALRALARLNPEEFANLFRKSLSERSPSVSREAMKGLNKVVHLLAGEDLWAIFAADSEIHIRRNVLFLVARLGKWESISYLVEAVGGGDENVRKLAQTYIRRWHTQFNSSFTAPTKVQSERLTSALQRARLLLDNEVLRQIEYGLHSL